MNTKKTTKKKVLARGGINSVFQNQQKVTSQKSIGNVENNTNKEKGEKCEKGSEINNKKNVIYKKSNVFKKGKTEEGYLEDDLEDPENLEIYKRVIKRLEKINGTPIISAKIPKKNNKVKKNENKEVTDIPIYEIDYNDYYYNNRARPLRRNIKPKYIDIYDTYNNYDKNDDYVYYYDYDDYDDNYDYIYEYKNPNNNYNGQIEEIYYTEPPRPRGKKIEITDLPEPWIAYEEKSPQNELRSRIEIRRPSISIEKQKDFCFETNQENQIMKKTGNLNYQNKKNTKTAGKGVRGAQRNFGCKLQKATLERGGNYNNTSISFVVYSKKDVNMNNVIKNSSLYNQDEATLLRKMENDVSNNMNKYNQDNSKYLIKNRKPIISENEQDLMPTPLSGPNRKESIEKQNDVDSQRNSNLNEKRVPSLYKESKVEKTYIATEGEEKLEG